MGKGTAGLRAKGREALGDAIPRSVVTWRCACRDPGVDGQDEQLAVLIVFDMKFQVQAGDAGATSRRMISAAVSRTMRMISPTSAAS